MDYTNTWYWYIFPVPVRVPLGVTSDALTYVITGMTFVDVVSGRERPRRGARTDHRVRGEDQYGQRHAVSLKRGTSIQYALNTVYVLRSR